MQVSKIPRETKMVTSKTRHGEGSDPSNGLFQQSLARSCSCLHLTRPVRDKGTNNLLAETMNPKVHVCVSQHHVLLYVTKGSGYATRIVLVPWTSFA